MKTCTDRQNLMLEYLYDLLDDVERHDLLGHADSCPNCAAALHQARIQKGQLAAAAKREFPNVRFVAPAETQPATQPLHRIIIKHPWVRYALAASVLIAIGVTVVIRNPWSNGVAQFADGGDPKDPQKWKSLTGSPINVDGPAGKVVNGLQAIITLPKERQFKLGAPRILVAYNLQNTGKEPLMVWHRNFWPNHQVFVWDAKGKEVTRKLMGEQGHGQFKPHGPADPAQRFELPGGEFDRAYETQNLAIYFQFDKPGKYKVQIAYEAHHSDSWEGRVETTIEEFEIVP
jgi:hypothetical protein